MFNSKKILKNLVMLLLCAVITATLLTPMCMAEEVKAENPTVTALEEDGFEKVTSSGGLSMYADMQSGDFAIVNDKTGFVWRTSPEDVDEDPFTDSVLKGQLRSVISIDYIINKDENKNATPYSLDSYTECVQNDEVSVEEIDGGIQIVFNFKTIETKIPVKCVLNDGYFDFSVDFKNMEISDEFSVTTVRVLPAFGAGSWKDNGYLFVPDGSGALINYNNGNSLSYSKKVYEIEPSTISGLQKIVEENISLPIFGSKNGEHAFFSVITEGDGIASISAASSYEKRGYNTVYSSVNYRTTTQKTMFANRGSEEQQVYRLSPIDSNFEKYNIRYYLLSGESANYIGMAEIYRDYLISEGLSATVSKPSLNVDLYGAIDVDANFLGFTYKKVTPLTTFEQAQTIASELKGAGIDNLSFRYIGWQNTGVSNKKLLKNAKAISKLGGKKGLEELLSYSDENLVSLTLDTDLLTFRKASAKYVLQNAFNEQVSLYKYMRSVYATRLDATSWKLLKPTKFAEVADKYLKSFIKLGAQNISLSSLTNSLYSDFNNKNVYSRSELTSVVGEIIASYKEQGLSVSGDNANGYTLPLVDKVYNAPLFSSGYTLFDEEIPFYEIVLHGYTTMISSPAVQSCDVLYTYLRSIEAGVELCWSGIYENSANYTDTEYDDMLYCTTYTLWKDEAAAKYAAYQPLLEKIYDQKIVGHGYAADGVSVTTYESGIKVYVNYNDTDVTVDGITVSAKNFSYKGV